MPSFRGHLFHKAFNAGGYKTVAGGEGACEADFCRRDHDKRAEGYKGEFMLGDRPINSGSDCKADNRARDSSRLAPDCRRQRRDEITADLAPQHASWLPAVLAGVNASSLRSNHASFTACRL
jgi:hypothetical protein